MDTSFVGVTKEAASGVASIVVDDSGMLCNFVVTSHFAPLYCPDSLFIMPSYNLCVSFSTREINPADQVRVSKAPVTPKMRNPLLNQHLAKKLPHPGWLSFWKHPLGGASSTAPFPTSLHLLSCHHLFLLIFL